MRLFFPVSSTSPLATDAFIMKIHCLGTVGYHPNQDRHTSCYFLPESGILLDAGSGIFRLAPFIQTPRLHILLSHAHLDHTIGLTFLLDVLFQHPVDELHLWGEAEKLEAVQSHLFNNLIFPAKLNCQWHAIDDQPSLSIEDTVVSWRAQSHPGGSVAYRIDWANQSKRLVYASDTTGDLSDEHARWSRDADLLMHECYFRDSAAEWAEKTGHTYSSRVAEVANNSSPKKLLLTHVNPLETGDDLVGLDVIQKKTQVEVVVASDEMQIDF